MYAVKDIFRQSADFSGAKTSWKDISDTLLNGSKDKRDALIDKLACASYLTRDSQRENILTRYDLHEESEQEKQKRQHIQSLLGL